MSRVILGGHDYVVDLTRTQRSPISALRQAVDQGTERGEQSLDNAALWRRTADDFVLGAGQKFFDQSDEANRRRHWLSYGLDCLSERRYLGTARAFSTVVSAFVAAANHRLLRTGSNFWWGSTSQLHRSASLTDFAITPITGGVTANFRDMAVHGSTMYVAFGASGIYSGSVTGSTVASFSTQACTAISADLGRLVGANGAELFEISMAGVKSTIFTHNNPQWTWITFAAGNAGIYVAGTDGMRSEIYMISVIDATGALSAPVPVAQLPVGELVRRMVFFGGYLVLGTSSGARVAEASQSGFLNYGPLLSFGDVRGVAFEGRNAYVTTDSINPGAMAGITVLSLERFTQPLTPAYAALYPIGVAGYTAWDVALYNGTVVGLFNDGASNHLRSSNQTTYANGVWHSGLITYGVSEPKRLVALELKYDPLPVGITNVMLYVYDAAGNVLASQTDSTPGSTGMIMRLTDEVLEEEMNVVVALFPGTATTPIVVRRMTARSMIVPEFTTEEILLPLQLSREVRGDDGEMIQVDPMEEWSYLAQLSRSRVVTELTFGTEVTDVIVDQVGVTDGSWVAWDPTGEWPQGTVMVRLVTLQGSE